jgi:hypothetical protein
MFIIPTTHIIHTHTYTTIIIFLDDKSIHTISIHTIIAGNGDNKGIFKGFGI